jgi:uncharacterized protein
MDYYERVLFNHRMGTIDPETGTTVYHLALGNGYSKIYAKPFDSFWCCSCGDNANRCRVSFIML